MPYTARLAPVPRTFTAPGASYSLSYRFQTNRILRLADEVKGFWTKQWYTGVANANAAMAAKVQEGMVERLDEEQARNGRLGVSEPSARLGRWAHGPNALRLSLLDERNRWVSASGYKVMLYEWMDQSPAQHYWRNIESGRKGYMAKAVFFRPGGGPFMPDRTMQGMHEQMPHSAITEDGGPTAFRGRLVWVDAFYGYQYTRGGQVAMDRLDPLAYYKTFLGAMLIPLQIRGAKV